MAHLTIEIGYATPCQVINMCAKTHDSLPHPLNAQWPIETLKKQTVRQLGFCL
jgi:hypothetical protein